MDHQSGPARGAVSGRHFLLRRFRWEWRTAGVRSHSERHCAGRIESSRCGLCHRFRSCGCVGSQQELQGIADGVAPITGQKVRCCWWLMAVESRRKCRRISDDIFGQPGVKPAQSAFYSALDVFVMPSKMETFGLAALEAMACGTPVVAYRTGGIPDFVEDGVVGLLARTSRSP